MKTIQEARDFLNSHIEKGINCPCCNQFAKIYTRPIDSTAAAALISLVILQEKKQSYIHVNEIFTQSKLPFSCGKNIGILKHWNLIEELKNKDSKKRTSGYWIATDLGVEFTKVKCTVHKYAVIYYGKCQKLFGEQVNIKDCLKRRFNYEELMGWTR